MARERVTASCTAVSWIPSEAMEGFMRLPLDVGIGHYDQPPPDEIGDIDALVAAGQCRFVNRLEVWADIDEGRIITAGCKGGGRVASTEISVGRASLSVPAIAFPDLRATEADGDRSITYVQTAGGRTGAPFPRRSGSGLTMKLVAPTAWTSVAITINGDGTSSFKPRGASRFPRHWFYGTDGRLVAKSARIDYRDWTSTVHDDDTPWGNAHTSIEIAACETAIERVLSPLVMQGDTRPTIRKVDNGDELMRIGEPATTMMLVLDGMVEISIDGKTLAESGPGTLLGERAALESGTRTSTVRALTAVKVAEFPPEVLGDEQRQQLRTHHQRELQ